MEIRYKHILLKHYLAMPNSSYILGHSVPFAFVDDALKEDFSSVKVALEVSTEFGDNDVRILDTTKSQLESEFLSNLCAWNCSTGLRSVNNYSSGYFDAIVKMKEAAVPFIYRELQKGPTPLVHALDYIYEGEVEYEGYLPLDFVCTIWLEILKQKGISV